MQQRLIWRYRRDGQVVYVRAEHEGGDFRLIWQRPDGTSRSVRMANPARLFDYLNRIEEDLGSDGWELLPVNQRAPNRLATPLCDICAPGPPAVAIQRTTTHVHFECPSCHRTWIVPKPGC